MGLREDLKRKLDESGITVERLSRLADVNDGTIRNFLNCESEMTAKIYDKLIDVLDRYKTND